MNLDLLKPFGSSAADTPARVQVVDFRFELVEASGARHSVTGRFQAVGSKEALGDTLIGQLSPRLGELVESWRNYL